WFRPTVTTEEMKRETKNPNFEYVVACNKLCGSGHYNMKKTVKVVTQEEYEKWFSEQKSYYYSVVKPSEGNASDTAKVKVVAMADKDKVAK
ncbi:MAG TPA: cytochrome c oxidase subunit II, partial [Chitinophagales bacterium]|nr:cytochrome c oxidase subunit II [Chitinophagales bacterium]